MRAQIEQLVIVLKDKPEGLTLKAIASAINTGRESPYAPSTFNYWLKEAVSKGLIIQAEPLKARGRPSQVFKLP